MRKLLLSAAMMLTACQSTPSNPLTDNDWTNGQQPCSKSNLSFKNERIVYNVIDGQIPMFDIDWVAPVPKETEYFIVHAKPAKELQASLKEQGKDWPSGSQPTLLFRVHEGRLSLVGIARNRTERVHVPAANQANRFNLVACPS